MPAKATTADDVKALIAAALSEARSAETEALKAQVEAMQAQVAEAEAHRPRHPPWSHRRWHRL